MKLGVVRRFPSSALSLQCGEWRERGLVAATFPSPLPAPLLSALPPVVYAGFDPTAASLHIGHLTVLSPLLRALLAGCRAIAVVGGGTALIGDPAGTRGERTVLSAATVAANAVALTAQISSLVAHLPLICPSIPPSPLLILNNLDWHGDMSLLDYMHQARHFRLGAMLKRRAVRSRRDNDQLNYVQFSYQILQALDWLHLLHTFDCRLQIGGLDQLGNFDAGYHLCKSRTGIDVAGICVPLLTDEQGRKLGKSTSGDDDAVWLCPERTSPFAFYQFFLRRSDAAIPALLRQFSFRPLADIEQLIADRLSTPWALQRELAREMTLLVHGQLGLESAERCSQALFSESRDALHALSQAELQQLFGKTVELRLEETPTAETLAAAVFGNDGPALVRSGGFRLNFAKINDPTLAITDDCFLPNRRLSVVGRGRRVHSLIKWI